MGRKKVLRASWMLRSFSGVRSERRRISDVPLWIDSDRRAVVFALLAFFLLFILSFPFHGRLRRVRCDRRALKTGWIKRVSEAGDRMGGDGVLEDNGVREGTAVHSPLPREALRRQRFINHCERWSGSFDCSASPR
jgi:hypothetical protein